MYFQQCNLSLCHSELTLNLDIMRRLGSHYLEHHMMRDKQASGTCCFPSWENISGTSLFEVLGTESRILCSQGKYSP